MRPSTPRLGAQSAAPTSKSDPDDQPRKKIWKGAQKSTCKKVGSPSRPPNLAAAARRACQGWPRLRGRPLDPMLVGGWSGDRISFPTIQPQRLKMLHLDPTDAPARSEYATVYLVFELSKAKWKL